MGTWVAPDCRLTANALLWALVAAMASGCSTIGDGSGQADGAPAGTDAATVHPDAEVPLGPFSEPRLIEALSDPLAGDADPSLTEDALELFFSSSRTGSAGTDIWVSERESVADDWGDPHLVVELNSADAELDPEVSFDGLTIYFNSTRVVEGAQGGFDLYFSTRGTRDRNWSPPDLIPMVNSAQSDMGAVMDRTQTTLVFHRDVATDLDLFIAERQTPDDTWDTPAPLSIDSDAQEADAWLSADGLSLYFNSNRTGGTGDSDIYRTTRLSTGTIQFDDPDELAEVNTEFHEANVALARGGRYLVLSSARSGNQELWEASR